MSGERDILNGIELVVFDKDGTLIDFHAMWGAWVTDLAARLEATTGSAITETLFGTMGFDPSTGRTNAHGKLAATPMPRLFELTIELVAGMGVPRTAAREAVERAWGPPDPVTLARPLADLHALFFELRAAGRQVAVATTDDRDPTERTLAALGVDHLVDALVCADDGVPVKPDAAMVHHLATALGVIARRTAVVGDTPVDLRMGRAAEAGLVVAVLSGVGERGDLEPYADLVLASVAELVSTRS